MREPQGAADFRHHRGDQRGAQPSAQKAGGRLRAAAQDGGGIGETGIADRIGHQRRGALGAFIGRDVELPLQLIAKRGAAQDCSDDRPALAELIRQRNTVQLIVVKAAWLQQLRKSVLRA